MESFIISKDKKYVSGEKAYELLETTKTSNIIDKVKKQYMYTDLLEKADCFEC
jgi:hypothetical protein